ncbi:hypothetical protein [Nocardioides cynanchi]|uniref:hypothetical protein n=1 Tax=Nocardioides cynanchi TaxID=2558918 RepID=UPI001245D3CC|nr:hypothetical protein [Nocardioides cynanchi]
MSARHALVALATCSALALPLTTVAPALASHGGGDDVRTHGGCQGRAVWKLKVKLDSGRIEFEGEVDSNHRGQVWDWKVRHDGSVSAKGSSTTAGTSGSFTVNRRMADLAGTDTFAFRAERRTTGAVCRGTISL